MKKKTRGRDKLLIALVGSALASAAVPAVTWAISGMNHNETLVRDAAKQTKKKAK
jgi:hypothetical protein